MENIVKINGADYLVKNTIRSIFIFEEITGKPFKVETIRDNYLFFYSVILANNTKDILTWESFIDALDKDPKIYIRMNEILAEANKVDELLAEESDDGKKKD